MLKKNSMKRMSKRELLELLVLLSKKNDELQKELDRVNEILNDKKIMISNAGSIAADQFLDNIKMLEK